MVLASDSEERFRRRVLPSRVIFALFYPGDVEYTTRNSLPVDSEARSGAEVLDDRTIRFKGKDILEAWRLYRSR